MLGEIQYIVWRDVFAPQERGEIYSIVCTRILFRGRRGNRVMERGGRKGRRGKKE